MPIDVLHGRRIPSGHRLFVIVRDMLRAMLPHAQNAVRQGREPDFSRFEQQFMKAVLPIVLHEYQLGREQIARELLRRRSVKGWKTKTSNFLGISLDWNLLRDAVPRAIQRAVLNLVGSVTNTIKTALRDRIEMGVRAGESNAQIADRIAPIFAPSRAYTIAATEASSAMHAGESEYAEEHGAAGLEWMASSDACELCLPLDGKRVEFGKPFLVHTHGDPAYQYVMHPPAHPRCMCTAVPWWKD